jgi:hypothetical protein
MFVLGDVSGFVLVFELGLPRNVGRVIVRSVMSAENV